MLQQMEEPSRKEFRALFRGNRKELGKPCKARDHAAALVADAGGDKAGKRQLAVTPRPLQPASKFAREKNVAAQIARVIERLVKTPLMSDSEKRRFNKPWRSARSFR
jgi:hypothetical protein